VFPGSNIEFPPLPDAASFGPAASISRAAGPRIIKTVIAGVILLIKNAVMHTITRRYAAEDTFIIWYHIRKEKY